MLGGIRLLGMLRSAGIPGPGKVHPHILNGIGKFTDIVITVIQRFLRIVKDIGQLNCMA